MKHLTTFFIIIICFYSCNKQYKTDEESNGNYLVINKYKGRVLDSLSYSDSLLNGLQKRVYKDSNIVVYVEYEDGNLDGKVNAYYLDKENQLKYKGQYEGNQETGEWIFYNKDGTLNTYKFYLPDGKLGYMRLYGKSNDLLSSHGKAFMYINRSASKDSFKLKGVIELNINMAVPPYCKAVVDVYLGKEKNENREVRRYETSKDRIYFKKMFFEAGENILQIDWQLNDTLNNKIEKGVEKYYYQVNGSY